MRQDIIVFPDNRLRDHSSPVDFSKKEEVQKIATDLMDTIWLAGDHAAGLSAIQIGVPLRVFIMRDEKGVATIVANPEIVECVGHPKDISEGCLSLPGVFETVQRYDRVKVKYREIDPVDFTNKTVEAELEGLESQVFQHESEHLNGMVLTDKLTPALAKTISNRLNKWKTKGYWHPPRSRAA